MKWLKFRVYDDRTDETIYTSNQRVACGSYISTHYDESHEAFNHIWIGNNPEYVKDITELQDLHDRLYKVVEILHRKQKDKELITVQALLLEEIADEMREILVRD